MTNAFTQGPLFPPFLPQDQAMAYEADGQLSPYGFDCCEESRSLSYHSLRYQLLLGECLDCGARTTGAGRDRATLMRAGWHGPVKRADPEPVEYWHGE